MTIESDHPPGTHLVVPRFKGLYTHHGIYVGAGRVIHYAGLANGLKRGPIEEVDLAQFSGGQPISVCTHTNRPARQDHPPRPCPRRRRPLPHVPEQLRTLLPLVRHRQATQQPDPPHRPDRRHHRRPRRRSRRLHAHPNPKTWIAPPCSLTPSHPPPPTEPATSAPDHPRAPLPLRLSVSPPPRLSVSSALRLSPQPIPHARSPSLARARTDHKDQPPRSLFASFAPSACDLPRGSSERRLLRTQVAWP